MKLFCSRLFTHHVSFYFEAQRQHYISHTSVPELAKNVKLQPLCNDKVIVWKYVDLLMLLYYETFLLSTSYEGYM